MRKNNLLKKTAWIVLSAVLFGTVAGTVMTGIQIASSGMVSQFFAIVASDEDTVKAEGRLQNHFREKRYRKHFHRQQTFRHRQRMFQRS